MSLSLAHDKDSEDRPVLTLNVESVRRGGEQIIGRLELSAMAGETIAIVGPSGIGKTTLLRVVAGLQDNFDGSCEASDRSAMVFQEPRLLPWRTLVQNLTIATGIPEARARSLLADAGLEGKGEMMPGELSLGQQRRVSLARAFATDPELLLMDEPFVSLDAETAEAMMALYARLRAQRATTTLLVTHSMEEARKLASRIVTLGGRPATIQDDRQNKGAYFQLSASGVTSSKS